MRLQKWSEARDALLAAGLTESEARWSLSKNNPDRIAPHPHRMHSQQLWSPSVLKAWIEKREEALTACGA
jgi:hypothetical protein